MIPMPRGFTLADLPRTELDVARDEELAHLQVIRQGQFRRERIPSTTYLRPRRSRQLIPHSSALTRWLLRSLP